MWRNCKSCTLLMGTKYCATTVENGLVIPQYIKHWIKIWLRNFPSVYIPKCLSQQYSNNLNVEKMKCLSTNECENNIRILAMGYYSSRKWNINKCCKMNEHYKCHDEWRSQNRQIHGNRMQISGCQRLGGRRNRELMRMEFPFHVMKMLWIQIMLTLSQHCKCIKCYWIVAFHMVNFLYISLQQVFSKIV